MTYTHINLLSKFPRFFTLDLEIAKVDIDPQRPFIEQGRLGIACAAMAIYDQGNVKVKTWAGTGNRRMTTEQAGKLAREVYNQSHICPLFTWNGAAFDLRVLVAESSISLFQQTLSRVAKNHYDMMLMAYAAKGFRVKLSAMAEGMGVTPKKSLADIAIGCTLPMNGVLTKVTEENKHTIASGALAPLLWEAGERDAVLEYCKGDAITTLEIAKAMMINGGLNWKSGRGNEHSLKFRDLATVDQVRSWPVPDTSWMDSPAPDISEAWEWMYNPQSFDTSNWGQR